MELELGHLKLQTWNRGFADRRRNIRDQRWREDSGSRAGGDRAAGGQLAAWFLPLCLRKAWRRAFWGRPGVGPWIRETVPAKEGVGKTSGGNAMSPDMALYLACSVLTLSPALWAL